MLKDHKRISGRAAVGTAALALVALVGCAGGEEAGTNAPAPASALAFGQAGNPAEADRTIEVKTLDSMRFDPEDLDVSEGEIIRFVVTNEGKVPHEFTLGDEAEQQKHAEEMAEPGMMAHDHPFAVWLEAGETKELAWEFSEAGTFFYGCHVPGHYEAGMKGTVTVR